jgi:diguanylate cyclase (GGDEF)-like protein
VSTPAQIAAAIAAIAAIAEVTYRLLKRRFHTRRFTTLIRAAHMARLDELTGLGTRLAFREAVRDAAGKPVAVILVNLDGSRVFVSRLGHRALDQLLVLTAGRVNHCASAAGGSSFRLRRDEFAVMVDDPAEVSDLAARLISAVAEPTELHIDGHHLTITVTACAAVTTFTAHGAGDARPALVQADSALRAAKKAGRGRVAVFEPAMLHEPSDLRQPPSAPGIAEDGGAR